MPTTALATLTLLLASATVGLWAAEPAAPVPVPAPTIAARVQDAVPLTVGMAAPDALVTAADGTVVHLAAVFAGKPTVVIFFRGGWCPYCSAHLRAVAGLQDKLIALGWQTVAIGTDTPETSQAIMRDQALKYRLFSDRELVAAAAFGVAYRLDADTVKAYTGYKVPMVSPQGGGPALPVPSVFLIDAAGVITFVHADADITKRLGGPELLEAASPRAK